MDRYKMLRRCEEIVFLVELKWTLRLVDYPLDPSNPRVNLSTKHPRLRSLDLLSPSQRLTTDNRTSQFRVGRKRM